MTRGSAVTASGPLRGFDCNAVVTPAAARLFAADGFRFAARYIRRSTRAASDLSFEEIQDLFDVGIATTPVQHVESEKSWTPTDEKGRAYGQSAVDAARELGLPGGSSVWLDLEGVGPEDAPDSEVDVEQVIRYCNYWFDRVYNAGFQPGIYVGWHNRLSPVQLRKRLKFGLYWGAFNLNTDQYPADCGLAMKQHAAKAGEKPAGVPFDIDTDTINGDRLGRFPTLYAPDGWR